MLFLDDTYVVASCDATTRRKLDTKKYRGLQQSRNKSMFLKSMHSGNQTSFLPACEKCSFKMSESGYDAVSCCDFGKIEMLCHKKSARTCCAGFIGKNKKKGDPTNEMRAFRAGSCWRENRTRGSLWLPSQHAFWGVNQANQQGICVILSTIQGILWDSGWFALRNQRNAFVLRLERAAVDGSSAFASGVTTNVCTKYALSHCRYTYTAHLTVQTFGVVGRITDVASNAS